MNILVYKVGLIYLLCLLTSLQYHQIELFVIKTIVFDDNIFIASAPGERAVCFNLPVSLGLA